MMNNNDTTGALRLPAEWEQQDAIMMVWPHSKTDWAYMLPEVRECFCNIIRAIINEKEHLILITPNDEEAENVPVFDSPFFVKKKCQSNDTWARDTCAITTSKDGKLIINDFQFNGWGLKFAACYDNLITSTLFKEGLFNGTYANHLSFALEGGSIESDGEGTLLTTSECLLSPHRNGGMTKEEIERYLINAFGVRKVLWLDHGYLEGDDTDSHIDTLARIAPGNTILYVATDDETDAHYEALKEMEKQLATFTNAKNEKFNLVKLPHPQPIYDEEGNRLPATYANFLIGNGFVLVPTYNQPENDRLALDTIQSVFSNFKIIGIDCNALIQQHGSLHCVTMQFPANTINNL